MGRRHRQGQGHRRRIRRMPVLIRASLCIYVYIYFHNRIHDIENFVYGWTSDPHERRRRSVRSSVHLAFSSKSNEKSATHLRRDSGSKMRLSSTSSDDHTYLDSLPTAKMIGKPKISLPSRRQLQKRQQRWDKDTDEEEQRQTQTSTPLNSAVEHLQSSSGSMTRSLRRRPKYYWNDVENIRHEIVEQWKVALGGERYLKGNGIPDPPPIPNDTLLMYWKRHDLRSAIRKYGGGGCGRQDIADEMITRMTPEAMTIIKTEKMTNSEAFDSSFLIVPGKWKDAVDQFPIVRRVVENDPNLQLERPPRSLQYLKEKEMSTTSNDALDLQEQTKTFSQHSNNQQRVDRQGWKPMKYWSQQQVLISFYDFLQQRYDHDNIPKVWMPRLKDINDEGLRQTLIKMFGKDRKKNQQQQQFRYDDNEDEYDGMKNGDVVSSKIGLIKFDEWNYFERQFDLMVSLKEYLDENCDGDYRYFPRGYVSLPSQGYHRLFRLIQDFGGRKIIAGRFGMKTGTGTSRKRSKQGRQKDTNAYSSSSMTEFHISDLSWGPFDLETGIVILGIVRQRQMELEPPLDPNNNRISMPSPSAILILGGVHGQELHNKILRYGGYENVGRRLGLAIDYKKGVR